MASSFSVALLDCPTASVHFTSVIFPALGMVVASDALLHLFHLCTNCSPAFDMVVPTTCCFTPPLPQSYVHVRNDGCHSNLDVDCVTSLCSMLSRRARRHDVRNAQAKLKEYVALRCFSRQGGEENIFICLFIWRLCHSPATLWSWGGGLATLAGGEDFQFFQRPSCS